MRALKVITALMAGVLAVFLLLVYCQLTRKYVRFEHQSSKYHAEFATACDSILAQHPLGTNGFLEISTTDTSLPRIVGDLHPERIKVSTNCVWVLVDGTHTDGLVVLWETQWGPEGVKLTNVWNLEIGNGEDGLKAVYVLNH
jgi:hypothetical protein